MTSFPASPLTPPAATDTGVTAIDTRGRQSLGNRAAEAASDLRARQAEGARYALLRRLAPAIRHDMAGALQPISMVAAMLEKRLHKPDPDLLALGKNVDAINLLAKEASQACMNLMTWLSPRQDTPLPLGEGIAEALSLVTTDLSFKGFTLVNQTSDVTAALRISVLRGLFMAAVLALTDSSVGPARVRVEATEVEQGVVLHLTVEPTDGGVLPTQPASYRVIDWDDVRVLADAEGVSLVLSPHRVELRCPLA